MSGAPLYSHALHIPVGIDNVALHIDDHQHGCPGSNSNTYGSALTTGVGCYSLSRSLKSLDLVRRSNGCGEFHINNDSARTLFLTWYTIWCSSWRRKNK